MAPGAGNAHRGCTFKRPSPCTASAPFHVTMPRIRRTWRFTSLFRGRLWPQAAQFLPHGPDRGAGDERTGNKWVPYIPDTACAPTVRAPAFSLPSRAWRSKEAACAVLAVARRMSKGWLSVLSVGLGSSRAVRAAGLRILPTRSSAANVARPCREQDSRPQRRAANRKAQRLQDRLLVLRHDPHRQDLRELHRKPSGAS
jgi:hypothetical protein